MSITGSIVLGLQALSNIDNSVIFNRAIQGLLNVVCSEAVQENAVAIASAGTLLRAPSTIFGLYVKNLSLTAVLTITSTGSGFNGTIQLQPGEVFLKFSPVNAWALSANISSTVDQSLADITFWA